jgi:long-chain acyl-CoA synthetase
MNSPPDKQSIRNWLAQRRGAPCPPPALCDIRDALWPAATRQAPTTPPTTPMNQQAQPWLASYRENNTPTHIDLDAYPSVVHLLEGAMRRFAGKTAFRWHDKSLSYADIDRLSGAFCAWLQQEPKVQKGERIAVMLPNIPAFPIATLGIARAGGIQVNINPMYTPRELEHQLVDSGATIIVVSAGATVALAQVIARTQVKTVIIVAPGDRMDPCDARLSDTVCFAAALREGAALDRVPVALCGADLLFLQYTGGTTGLSKGAMLSHRNLIANIVQFKAMNSDALRPGQEVIVTAIPLYHIFALMVNFLAYFSVGAENWLVDNPRDVDGFIDVLQKANVTIFVGVNTLYASLLRHPRIAGVPFGSLRLSIGGGAAVLRVVSDQWKALTGTFIREGYGLTETSPVVTFNPVSVQAFSGSTGVPFPGTDVQLLDDDGKSVAIGETGEVCVKGPQVMRGYWRQPDANRDAFTSDGYFKTGDIGVFDAGGFLKIVDRKKDLVIVSGFNVYPNEVEAVVSALPGVAECACTGVPDAKTGEALVLFVVVDANKTLHEAAVVAHCRSMLTAYKVPKIVRIVNMLPKSTVGKILRRELQQMLSSE